MKGTRSFAAATLMAAIALAPLPARSASCPVDPSIPDAQAVAEVDAHARNAFMRERIETGARRSRTWAAGWGAAYGIVAVTQLAVVPTVDRGTQIDLLAGATSATIGVLTRVIMLPRVLRERRRLRRRSFDSANPCEQTHALEQAMARAARQERRGHAWWMHLAALAYNAATGVVLGVALDRPLSASRQAAIGATVGQVMILTQPTTMADALERYRRASFTRASATWFTRPLVLRLGGGVSISGRF